MGYAFATFTGAVGSAELEAPGFLNENGRPFAATSVQAMLNE
jgi:hypothetical protein